MYIKSESATAFREMRISNANSLFRFDLQYFPNDGPLTNTCFTEVVPKKRKKSPSVQMIRTLWTEIQISDYIKRLVMTWTRCQIFILSACTPLHVTIGCSELFSQGSIIFRNARVEKVTSAGRCLCWLHRFGQRIDFPFCDVSVATAVRFLLVLKT